MSLFLLTHGINRTGPEERFASAAAQTHIGQAHLAGSGPSGRTCRECACWSHKAKVESWIKDGPPKPARCAKYRELMRGWGNPVPHKAMACRHFVPADEPVPLTKPEKVAS